MAQPFPSILLSSRGLPESQAPASLPPSLGSLATSSSSVCSPSLCCFGNIVIVPMGILE